MKTFVENPHHIGSHTLEEINHPDMFAGTQQIEKELIQLIVEEIFADKPQQQDGYVATGATEANIQATYYFQKEPATRSSQIGLVYLQDSYYSMPKGGNMLLRTSGSEELKLKM